jgi:hypothetical protein
VSGGDTLVVQFVLWALDPVGLALGEPDEARREIAVQRLKPDSLLMWMVWLHVGLHV